MCDNFYFAILYDSLNGKHTFCIFKYGDQLLSAKCDGIYEIYLIKQSNANNRFNHDCYSFLQYNEINSMRAIDILA